MANSDQQQNQFRLRELLTTQTDKWLLSWLLGVITALSVIGLLMMSGWFISVAAVAGIVALGSHSFNYMVPAAIIRVFAMLRTAGRYGEMMISHHAVFGLLQQLRVRFFERFAHLPLNTLSNTLQSAHAMHRLTHDIDLLDEFPLRMVSPWLIAISAVLMVAGLIVAWLGQPIIAFGLVVICLGMPLVLSLWGKHIAKEQQILSENRRVSLLNPLTALTHLLIWQKWHSQLQAFAKNDDDYLALQRRTYHAQSLTALVFHWFIASILVILLWQFNQNTAITTVTVMLALVLGVMGVADLVLPLIANYLALGNSMTAKNKLNNLLDNANVTQPSKTYQELMFDKPLSLSVQNLDAKMPQAIVGIKNFNMTVTQGQPMLITGRSGAGKSTLLQVLAHELVPQQGVITLNGQNWLAIDSKQHPNLFGYLGQQIDIFDQTLASNLRLGKASASDDELWQVLDMVGLKSWAMSQLDGLNTTLGEYGQAISGGQARRIALARLLLTPKAILLLDEPFAGLDKVSRDKLWQNLIHHQQNGLLIIVTHHVWQAVDEMDIIRLPEPEILG
ncbi:amino acid ABC transporter ATP-binding/permease protein [Faucicola mancuniensis]|uniref:amino acid ABC transporter ATP-binding/permease protein n=1 Tax=Faucicola mancuniensis TaxID=1309795 RepID=UPI00397731D8